jgi:hypothetical protein
MTAPACCIAAGEVKKEKKQQGVKVVSLNSSQLFAHLQQYKQVCFGVQGLLKNT